MLALYLLRHARAAPETETDDFGRPLDARGRADATTIGLLMARRGLSPRLALCSTARRARETLEMVLPSLPSRPAVEFDDTLYLAETGPLLRRLARAVASPVLLVGHNPGIAELAVTLTGAGEEAWLARLRAGIPTATLLEITFDASSWSDLPPRGGRLVRLSTPDPGNPARSND